MNIERACSTGCIWVNITLISVDIGTLAQGLIIEVTSHKTGHILKDSFISITVYRHLVATTS